MKKICALLGVLLLTACVDTPPGPALPDLDFARVAPVALDVEKIEVTDAYAQPMKPPNVEHLFRVPPDVAVKRLLEKALVASGASHTLRVTIDNAAVLDQELPVTEGVMGTFRREPSDIYKATVSLRFELVDPAAPDIVIGHAEIVARRNVTLLRGDSPAERDRAAFNLTKALMDDVAEGLKTTVRETFGKK
jgi:hypothetical protein